jgi:Fe-S-cluster containining protein
MPIDKKLRKLVKQVRDKRRRFVREFNAVAARMAPRKGRAISCSSCVEPWCCYQIVAAGLFEGAIIADHLLRTKQEDLFRRVAEQGAEQLGLYPGGRVSTDQEANDAAGSAWFNRREPCAFLRDGRCTIYQRRPIACSCYWAVTPAEQCAPPSGKDVATVNHSIAIAWRVSADTVFARAAGMGNGETLVVQLPLGYAVRLGFRLLTEGPESLHREDR